MSEREPKQIPVNLLEAVDKDAPVVEQVQRALRVLAVANKAIEAASLGIELVPASSKGEVRGQALNTETIGADEAALMLTNARRDELVGALHAVRDLTDDVMLEHMSATQVLNKLMDSIELRMNQIDDLANRKPD